MNYFISKHTQYSRREADRLILEGRVRVDKTIATLKTQIPDSISSIFIDGKRLKKNASYTALVYHKPKGELTSRLDHQNRRLIYDSLDKRYIKFMPVGRLDFSSEGLLILSDSKEVVNALMHSTMPRVYRLKIDSKITKNIIEAMQNGIFLKDAKAGGHKLSKIRSMEFAPMQFEIIKNSNISKLKVVLNEGKNRELRRFFAYFNANILDLKRVSYGFVHLNALPVGKVRFFSKKEYHNLKELLKHSQNNLSY